MSTFGSRNDLITKARQAATQILLGLDALDAIANEVTRGKWDEVIDATGKDPDAVGYKANDFRGHEGLIKTDFNGLLTAKDAIKATLAATTNLHGKALEEVRY
jgi:hypothetical protein